MPLEHSNILPRVQVGAMPQGAGGCHAPEAVGTVARPQRPVFSEGKEMTGNQLWSLREILPGFGDRPACGHIVLDLGDKIPDSALVGQGLAAEIDINQTVKEI